MTVASESDHGLSYASLSDLSMIASQSQRHCHLFGSASSSRSVCPALSSLSSSYSGLVCMVCSSGCCTSFSSDVEELSGQFTIQWALSLAILCWDVQYIICQSHNRPLLSSGKIIGETAHWSPLCFIHGGVLHQDTLLEHQGFCNAQVGSPFFHDLELYHRYHRAKVYCLAVAVAVQLYFCKGLWYSCHGQPNQLVPSI